jgi:flagellar protein FlaG
MNVNAVEAGEHAFNASVADAFVAAATPGTDISSKPKDKVEKETLPGAKQIREMVAEMQDQIDSLNVSLSFSTYGEKGERIAVVVADKATGDVIREIPAKEIQSLYAKMNELAGVIFDRKI